MRSRIFSIAAIVTALIVSAGPAMALETKPTNPPTTTTAPPPTPYVESVRYVGGNGDQVPDPGERLQVFFSLRNTTDATLSGVTGTLVVKGDGVSVVDGTASWPDIAPGALEESTTPLVIQIADSAARAQPCTGGPIAIPAPAGSNAPAPSDVPISSDGSIGTGVGSAPSSSPGSEPGSTPAAKGSIEPAGPGVTSPVIVEPAPSGSTEPAPGGSVEPAPSGSVEPQPPDTAPVPFDAAISVHTSSGSFDTDFVSGLACPLALGAPGTGGAPSTAAGGSEVAPASDVKTVATSATSSSAPFVIAVVLVAAGALVARYRFTP